MPGEIVRERETAPGDKGVLPRSAWAIRQALASCTFTAGKKQQNSSAPTAPRGPQVSAPPQDQGVMEPAVLSGPRLPNTTSDVHVVERSACRERSAGQGGDVHHDGLHESQLHRARIANRSSVVPVTVASHGFAPVGGLSQRARGNGSRTLHGGGYGWRGDSFMAGLFSGLA